MHPVLPKSHNQSGIDISTNDMAMTSKVSERNQVYYDAVCSGDLVTVQALILQGVDLDWPGGDGKIRPLHQSACNGYLEIVKCLVDAGATVDCVDDEGFTPLIWASVMFEHDIAAYLVSKGANISWIPDDGKSAIMNAASSEGGQTSHMLMLAALGWDIGDPGVTNGWTMLHRAVRDDLHHDNEVRMLVKKGDADVINKLAAASGGINVKDRLGLTPLHHAVRGQLVHEEEMWRDYDKGTWRDADFMSNLVPTKANMSLVRSLIASGSDPRDIDRYGHSVLWHAKYFGQEEVICLLKGDLEFPIPDQSKENIKIAVDEDNCIENNPLVDLLHKVPPNDSNATTWPRLALLELDELMHSRGIGLKDQRTMAPELNQLDKVHSNEIQVRPCDKSLEMVTWKSDVPSEAISLMAEGMMLPVFLNYVRQRAKNDEDLRAALHNRSSPPESPKGKPFAIKNLLQSPAINPSFRNSRGVLEVHEQMDCLVQRLVEEMNDISPMLELRVVLGGSVSEKTKIGLPDEYDYRLYVGALDGKCSVVREIEYDLSVQSWQRRTVSIRVSDDVSSSWSSYCDDSNVIDPAALFMHIHGVMYKCIFPELPPLRL
ncbi:protein phosphatase 1 regulatory subunit 12A-like [Anneissia japonica]|uniref:protein phosphatase 1 regulatory subunit 12A-like n=1 Tax=Anneissia japonica TaxID=1529436 RepID=UPI001425626F|nr:protein phosphatase 1 regulatory subunit 12A-like [Anneissia japonica]